MARSVAITILIVIATSLLPWAALAEERVYFYHNDHLGSPVAITDAGGNVVWKADYEPFGKSSTPTETVSSTHQFTGKELDSETGLNYFGARYYDPQIGRFLSFDSATKLGYSGRLRLLEPLSINPFVYVKNNPLRWIDPLGLWYLNTNFTGCAPVIYLCATGGYLVNTNVLYPYFGFGFGSPGISFSDTYSSSDPTLGLTVSLQGAYGGAGQVSFSVANRELSYEFGEGWPSSVSVTGSYVFDPNSALNWLWEQNKVFWEEDIIDVNYDEFYDEFIEQFLQENTIYPYEDLQLPWEDNYLIDEF